MKNEFNSNFENEFNNSSSFKSLEEFLNKEINNSFTPQEMILISISLNHVAHMLSIYNSYSNVAIFDVKSFTAKYPEYANIDFNHLNELDNDTLETINNLLHDEDGREGEEFSKGDILIKNVIKILLSTSLKLYDSYVKDYSKKTPEDTEQFFAMLDNCLESSLTLVKDFFTKGS